MESLTANSVIAELEQINSDEEVIKLGARLKRQMKNRVKSELNSPFLPIDVFEQIQDPIKARNFMTGVIYN